MKKMLILLNIILMFEGCSKSTLNTNDLENESWEPINKNYLNKEGF